MYTTPRHSRFSGSALMTWCQSCSRMWQKCPGSTLAFTLAHKQIVSMSGFSGWAPASWHDAWAPSDVELEDSEPPSPSVSAPLAAPLPSADPAECRLDVHLGHRDPNIPDQVLTALLGKTISPWALPLLQITFSNVKGLMADGMQPSTVLAATVQSLGSTSSTPRRPCL